jgi:uncharacterized protein YfaS (alpha-2-macroglobulin family)
MNSENFFISSTHRIGNIKVYVWTDRRLQRIGNIKVYIWTDRHLQPMALPCLSDGVIH